MNAAKFSNQICKNGFTVVKNLNDRSLVKKIKLKIIKSLDNASNLEKAVNISKAIEKKIKLRGVMIHQKKIFLTKKEFSEGFKKYSKKTDSVEVKDPLILIPELNNIIFSEKIISICKNFFKSSDVHVLYVALRCHFKNNLSDVGQNFYHLDETYDKTIKSRQILKYSIPFHLNVDKKSDKFEFNLIPIPTHKLIIKYGRDILDKMNYSTLSELKPFIKKKSMPDATSGDYIFFDPINFFHSADKPKKLRIMLYVVVGRKSNYIAKKTKKIKMLKDNYSNLSIGQKKFAKLIKKI